MINVIFKIAIPALACVTLTACGGSSTGVSSFDTIKTKGQQLIADYGTADAGTSLGLMTDMVKEVRKRVGDDGKEIVLHYEDQLT